MAHGDYLLDGITENAILPKEIKNYVPRTIVDNTLEYIDPTPNIHNLFMQFKQKFFYNKLDAVEVRWSKQMTLCAGTCTFQPSTRACVISLSAPLLKLRPRKDLVETLLHEMIHAYLFYDYPRENQEHGPKFKAHMNRINKAAGTNITIYHTFHDEVESLRQHIWRCNGVCQKKPPFYGMVRRASNRAPSKNDFWWAQHQMSCGGTFVKIKEPESYTAKKQKQENSKAKKMKDSKERLISDWIKTPNGKPISKPPSKNTKLPKSNGISKGKTSSKPTITSNTTGHSSGVKKLGNTTNKVHGFGTGGPGSSNSNSGSKQSSNISKIGNGTNSVYGWNTSSPNVKSGTNSAISSASGSKFLFSGTLGGSATGKSNLLEKYSTPSHNTPSKSNYKQGQKIKTNSNNLDKFIQNNKDIKQENDSKRVQCPICHISIPEISINTHIDLCLLSSEKSTKEEPNMNTKLNVDTIVINDDNINCPICQTSLKEEEINSHLDQCLQEPRNSQKRKAEVIEIDDSSPCSSTQSTDGQKCLICNSIIDLNTTLDEHLDDCIGNLFDDDTIDGESEKETNISNSEESKFPCPSCMTLIKHIDMNNHLDQCLLNS